MMREMLSQFSFGEPQWLWALAILPALLALFALAETRRRKLLQNLVASRLQAELAGSISVTKRRLRFAFALFALGLSAVALAQPRYGYTLEQAKRKGRDVLLVIDVSKSMLATDLAPNRLARAKLAAQDLINALQGDRLGLIAFAGSAFLQAPLTVDYSAVVASLNELDTDVIPLGGTNIAEAIQTAATAFGKGESESRCLILFTDGEELDTDALASAKDAAKTMRIFTVGIGSPEGALIPVPGQDGGTEFVKDPSTDAFVKSRLDEARLKEIAAATGGFYTRLQNNEADMRRVVDEGLGGMKEQEMDAKMARRPIERYQWPLGAGVALLMISLLLNERRRRKAKRVSAALLLALLPLHAQAETGAELYNEGKFEEAREQFERDLKYRKDHPALDYNRGAADYQLGKYDAAIAEFGKALASSDKDFRARAEYNLGTALLKRALQRDEEKEEKARKADLTNAIQHLDESLKKAPDNADAKTNLATARMELEKPKPTPPPQQQDQKKDDKKEDKKDEQDQQQNQQQNQQDQQKQEQQDQQKSGKQEQQQDQNKEQGGEKKEQSGEQQSSEQKPDEQKPGEQQSQSGEQKSDEQKRNEQQRDQQSPQPGDTPPPTQEKQLSGEVKANETPSQQEQSGQEKQAAEVAEKPGEMSEKQARAVLDSLKGEDGQPFKQELRGAAPVRKDW